MSDLPGERRWVACPGCDKSVLLRMNATIPRHTCTVNRVQYLCPYVGKLLHGVDPARRVTVTVAVIVPGTWSDQDAETHVGRALRDGLTDDVSVICAGVGQPRRAVPSAKHPCQPGDRGP